jgi:hypothetical protein
VFFEMCAKFQVLVLTSRLSSLKVSRGRLQLHPWADALIDTSERTYMGMYYMLSGGFPG